MLKNYFKVAFRNILKDKLYTFINIIGLSLGIASCLFILLFISDELSYEKFNTKADRIYRVIEFIEEDGAGEQSASAPFPVGPTLIQDYSNLIDNYVRFFNTQSPTILVKDQEADKQFNERNVYFVDSTFFSIFDQTVLQGNGKTALEEPNSIVLTESAAKKYFGDSDPIGKTLQVENALLCKITAVIKDSPLNSHIKYDILISFSTLKNFFGGQYPSTWYWNPCWTYIELNEKADPQTLVNYFPEFVEKYFPAQSKDLTRLDLQKLTDIHLKSNLQYEMSPNSSESNIYVFTLIGIIILFIAGMNYMNLSTARSTKRSKEVGLRKTLGGEKKQLIFQFLMESVIIVFIASLFSLFLCAVGLNYFNSLTEKLLGIEVLFTSTILIPLFIIFILIGIGSGLYPAFVLSSYIPVKVLKDSQEKGGRGALLRKILVVVQFSLSIILILGTIIAIDQLNFLRKSNTGFNTDQILYVSALRTPIGQNYNAFKTDLEKQESISSVTGVLDVLGSGYQGNNIQFEGQEASIMYPVFWVHHDFFKTFDLDIIAGRPFKETITTDDSLALVVNESFTRSMNWTAEETIGKPFTFQRFTGEIVGVVEDFNYESKHKPIGPLAIQLRTHPFSYNFALKNLAIRIQSDDVQSAVKTVETKWNELVPGRPFEFFLIDQ